jgi:hypothetical protein
MRDSQSFTYVTQIVTVNQHASPTEEGLDRLIHNTWHKEGLQEKLKKDNGWSSKQLEQVAWSLDRIL